MSPSWGCFTFVKFICLTIRLYLGYLCQTHMLDIRFSTALVSKEAINFLPFLFIFWFLSINYQLEMLGLKVEMLGLPVWEQAPVQLYRRGDCKIVYHQGRGLKVPVNDSYSRSQLARDWGDSGVVSLKSKYYVLLQLGKPSAFSVHRDDVIFLHQPAQNAILGLNLIFYFMKLKVVNWS